MPVPRFQALHGLTALAPLLALACASSTPVRPTAPAAAASVASAGPVSDIAATLVVEQFLRAANSNDLDAMARMFGNRAGPIAEQAGAKDVDRRMFVLASALHHDSYAVVRTEIVPGRRSEAKKIVVNLRIGERSVDVPFTVVQAQGDRILVEDFDIVKILSGN